jgi:hypothetical protein
MDLNKRFETFITDTQKLIIERFNLQEEKIKVLTDFLEYEEALTKDKDSATRIRIVLEGLGIWEQK